MNAWLSLAVSVELNALPLFIQITKIVGGVLVRKFLQHMVFCDKKVILNTTNVFSIEAQFN